VDPATLTGSRLPLHGLRETNELRVEADMPYSRTGAGRHRFTDTADGEIYLALHGALDNAQRVFAAFDQPDLKAPVTAAVTAPGNWTVIGNRLARPAGDGRWELATYLVTLVAGSYFSISTGHHGVPFGLHTRQSLAGHLRRDAAELLAVTRACFDRYREIFPEPYPYDSYDQAFVPELESGAASGAWRPVPSPARSGGSWPTRSRTCAVRPRCAQPGRQGQTAPCARCPRRARAGGPRCA
jgi:aminopeptidase N